MKTLGNSVPKPTPTQGPFHPHVSSWQHVVRAPSKTIRFMPFLIEERKIPQDHRKATDKNAVGMTFPVTIVRVGRPSKTIEGKA